MHLRDACDLVISFLAWLWVQVLCSSDWTTPPLGGRSPQPRKHGVENLAPDWALWPLKTLLRWFCKVSSKQHPFDTPGSFLSLRERSQFRTPSQRSRRRSRSRWSPMGASKRGRANSFFFCVCVFLFCMVWFLLVGCVSFGCSGVLVWCFMFFFGLLWLFWLNGFCVFVSGVLFECLGFAFVWMFWLRVGFDYWEFWLGVFCLSVGIYGWVFFVSVFFFVCLCVFFGVMFLVFCWFGFLVAKGLLRLGLLDHFGKEVPPPLSVWSFFGVVSVVAGTREIGLNTIEISIRLVQILLVDVSYPPIPTHFSSRCACAHFLFPVDMTTHHHPCWLVDGSFFKSFGSSKHH